jgi:DNA polymerase III subunit alpha
MFLARSYSHYSLLSAVPKIPALVDNAISKGFTTIALTDEDTGSCFPEFYDYCKSKGVNGVVGFTVRTPNISSAKNNLSSKPDFSKLAILCKNETGYKDLLKLITHSRVVLEKPVYHLTLDSIKSISNDLSNIKIIITGVDHEIYNLIKSNNLSEAKSIFEKYIGLFGNDNILCELGLPLINETIKQVKIWNLELIKLCKSLEVQYIVSPSPRYLEKEDDEVFKTVLAIRDGKRAVSISLNRESYLPSVSQLRNDYDYAIECFDTSDIEAEFNFHIRTDYDKNVEGAFFPVFNLPKGETPDIRLKWETYIGFLNRFRPEKSKQEWKEIYSYEKFDELHDFCETITPNFEILQGYDEEYFETNTVTKYIERIDYELDIIITKGYADYFLVFGDIMSFCRDNGIVINTRGSAAGSMVGLLNSINILDPIMYIIPFERFLNPLRPSPPDIDGDFADDKRHLVINYIKEHYGDDHVCQIVTFGTMLPRAAVRDVGRALGVSYKKCDKLSKLIPIAPQGKKTTFDWAMETSEELRLVVERDEEANQIITLARKIEANFRHASCHAAGVIISPTKMVDYCPLQWDNEHNMVVCQYDMRNCEKIGLVKLDILGIRNLAILGNAIEITMNRRNLEIDLLNIDLNSEKTFELLSKGRTMGTFQLSGAVMTKYLVEMGPTKVQDLMAMVALYRPGPMASIPDYITRKKDKSKVEYIVPQMEGWMEASYGIFVYQEDLLMTAIELAGYDWGMADKLRKGMGKKIQEVIDEQHPIFVNGCVEHSGLDRSKAEEIWELMVPFGAYGFNKAHSSSYGMVAYWTAYMKAVYTVEFMTALMTAEASRLDKIAEAITECQEMGIDVLPPDVNYSFDNFSIDNETTIRYGLSSVKNLGSDVIKILLEDRQKNGIFKDMSDFLDRMAECKGFNKRSLEALVVSGCLDTLGEKELISIGLLMERSQEDKVAIV